MSRYIIFSANLLLDNHSCNIATSYLEHFSLYWCIIYTIHQSI